MKPSGTQLLTNRSATVKDLDLIATIISACSTRLEKRQLPDWKNYYSISRLTEKLSSQSAYIFYLDTAPVGVVFVSEKELYYYTPEDISHFSGRGSPSLYISTLAISPEYQHRGFATQIVKFCEELSSKKNIKYVRLDCNGTDLPLVDFYHRRGFATVASMEKELEYLLLEKILK